MAGIVGDAGANADADADAASANMDNTCSLQDFMNAVHYRKGLLAFEDELNPWVKGHMQSYFGDGEEYAAAVRKSQDEKKTLEAQLVAKKTQLQKLSALDKTHLTNEEKSKYYKELSQLKKDIKTL